MNVIRQLISSSWLAVGAVLVFTGVAQAATPSSSMNLLPARTASKVLTVSYVVSGDGGTVGSVNLYMKKGDDPWREIRTSFNPTLPFTVDVEQFGGDGVYAFYTQATLTTGEVEVNKLRAETATIVDTVAPPAPDAGHIFVNQTAGLTANQISGDSLAAEPYTVVDVYSNAALTSRVAAAGVNATGAFGPVEIGNAASVPYVWVTAIDRNGNRSVATMVANAPSFSGQVNNLVTASYVGDMLDLSFDAVAGVSRYLIEYRHAGGAVWSARVETTTTTPKLVGLDAGRAYDIRIAPVDQAGNVGRYSFVTTRTAGERVDSVVLPPTVAVGGDTLSPVVVATVAPSAPAAGTPAGTPTDTTAGTTAATVTDTAKPPAGETATEETGTPPTEEVTAPADTDTAGEEAAPTEEAAPAEDGSSATPWVILAILIILAGIATGGYFYWFSGPEEVTTTVKPEKKEEEDKRW